MQDRLVSKVCGRLVPRQPQTLAVGAQIGRADFVDKAPKITSMPIQSGTAEKMTSLLLKSAAQMGGLPRPQSCPLH